MKETDYLADLARKRYDPPVTRTWEPGQRNDDHVHQKDLYLLVLRGGMTVAIGASSYRLTTGGACEVPAGALHSEQVDADGVSFLVAAR
ncbi:MAG: cupin domain-containing protein [Planctomycetes bacterium]|nr:cupin domain-containing protein [Planctomycetota bacterium]